MGVEPEGVEEGIWREQEQKLILRVQPPCCTLRPQPKLQRLQWKLRELPLWWPGWQRRNQQRDLLHQATAHEEPKEGELMS